MDGPRIRCDRVSGLDGTRPSPLEIPTRIFSFKAPFGDSKGRSSSMLVSNSSPARTADSVEFSFPVKHGYDTITEHLYDFSAEIPHDLITDRLVQLHKAFKLLRIEVANHVRRTDNI